MRSLERFKNWVIWARGERKVLLFIVYVALFLDNMLLTTVVPIIPEYLFRLWNPELAAQTMGSATGTMHGARHFALHKPVPAEEDEDVQRFKRDILFEPLNIVNELSNSGDRFLKMISSRARRQLSDTTDAAPRAPDPMDPQDDIPDNGQDAAGGRYRRARKGPKDGPVFDNNRDGPDDGEPPDGEDGPEDADSEPTPSNGDEEEDAQLPITATGATPTMSSKQKADMSKMHKKMETENIYVGIMFGSKAVVQLITNPFIGPLTNRYGYTIPMFTGFCVMFVSTLIFAFGEGYMVLCMARALQGVGSACTSTSGMGMLAQAYPDDEERGAAMGIALGGLALGVLAGPTFGGILYEWSGKELPFLLLALLALFDGSLQFLVLQPHVDRGEPEGVGLKELIRDPYIVIAVGAITIGNLGIAMLEPTLPIHMMATMNSGSFERGIAFLPASISYLVGTNLFGSMATKIGRWLCGLIGLVIIGFALLCIPQAETVMGLIIPNGCMGFAIGMIDASMFPQMGYLVDLRHVGVYGSIYAIADAAFCFAFALGPFVGGPLVSWLHFGPMLYVIAIINFAYAPLMVLLRAPPAQGPVKETDPLKDGAEKGYGKFEDEYQEPLAGGGKSTVVNYSAVDSYQNQ